jgi:hypothetical protein
MNNELERIQKEMPVDTEDKHKKLHLKQLEIWSQDLPDIKLER